MDRRSVDSNFADEWYSIRDQIFDAPTMEQDEVISKFIELDQLLIKQITTLLHNSNYVENYLIHTFRELTTNQTRNRVIFLTEKSKKKISLYRYDEIKHMESLAELYVYFCHGQKQKFLAKLLTIPFSRIIFEELISYFLFQGKDYQETIRATAQLHHDMLNDKPTSSTEYEKLLIQVNQMEQTLQTDSYTLYGLISELNYFNQQYQQIRNQITKPYLRIVYSIAKRNANSQLQFFDNFQNGTLGLMYAVSTYAVSRQTIFSSYASWWVRQQVLYMMKIEINTIRIPVSLWEAYSYIEKVRNGLHGEATVADLVRETGYTSDKIQNITKQVKISQPFSLQHYIDNESKEDSAEFVEVLYDEEFEEKQEQIEHSQALLRWSTTLTLEERKIYALANGYLDWLPTASILVKDQQAERIYQLAANIHLKLKQP